MSTDEISETRSEMPDPLAPAAVPGPRAAPADTVPSRAGRRPWTWQQLVGGVIFAAVCTVAAVWYVPTVLSRERHVLTGSVVTGGVATLDFTASGEIQRIPVHAGERVRKGELLAREDAPAESAVLSADVTAVRSEKTRLAATDAARHEPRDPDAPTVADVAAVAAQVKLDQAQLTADQTRGRAAEILAPAAGTVIATNGSPGEAVTNQGIRDYASDTPHSGVYDTPRFSLLPEGPQTDHRAPTTSASLPVIALRTSSAWQVAALVPENSVSWIRAGEPVTITVPAAQIRAIPGRVAEILPTPVATSDGDEYQAVVDVLGRVLTAPLAGMAADVRLPDAAARDHR